MGTLVKIHKCRCVVHQPQPLVRQSTKFHSTPRPVTKENKSFWKDDPPLGGSICKDCYREYEHRPKSSKESTETPPDENMV